MPKKEPKVEGRQLAIIKDGMESPFWNEMKRIIQAEREEINDNILHKEELELTDKAVSDLIRWHGFLGYLVRLPETCIESLEKVKVNDGSDDQYPNDPYPLEEIREKIKNGK